MKRRILKAAVLLLFLGLAQSEGSSRTESRALAQDVPSWVTKSYHRLKDGNQLYSECQSAEKNLTILEDGTVRARNIAASGDLLFAGTCWGYIEAVVDSIPTDEGFEPESNVRFSQYVDVVLAYLRDNPNLRHLPAHFLTRTALSNAFPAKPKKLTR
jgi:hypothetical protein